MALRSLSSSASLRKKERESRFDVVDVVDVALALGSRKFHTALQVAGQCHAVGWTCGFVRGRAQVGELGVRHDDGISLLGRELCE